MDIRGHILLRLALIGNGVHAQERGSVDEQAVGITEAIDGAAGCRGDIRPYPVLELATVLAERDLFVVAVMEEARHGDAPPIGQQQPLGTHRLMPAEGLDEHIAIFLPATRATDMGLREAFDGLGHRCPSCVGHGQAVRTRLHHAERCRWPHEHPARAFAANERTDTAPQLRMDYCRERQKNDQKDIARHRMKDITNKTPQKQDATFPLLLTKKLRQQRYA